LTLRAKTIHECEPAAEQNLARPLMTVLFSGTAHPVLAQSIAHEAAIPLGSCAIERFPDGEQRVTLLESVRQRQVILVQPLSPPAVNDHLMELLLLADACRRAAAASILAVIPYFGYARSDKRHGHREAIGARVVADLLETVGIQHIVTMDLHAPQIEGFFHRPVDCLTAVPALCQALSLRLPAHRRAELVLVSPDAGRVHMASDYASRLGAPVAVVHKRRTSEGTTAVTHLAGDVKNKSCVIIDDLISTGSTIVQAANVLLKAGARPEIAVAATHGIFVPGAQERLREVGISELFVMDTLPIAAQHWPQLQVVSSASYFAGILARFMGEGSQTPQSTPERRTS
jgi:ribose-phosphate pyrophosphokinase